MLRLPDLDALSVVAIGPPQTARRRRIDSAHVVEQADDSSSTGTPSPKSKVEAADQLVRLLKAPVLKAAPPWLTGGLALLGKTLVVLQQPKMALAAVVAIALQLAAVLAMLVGNGKSDPQPAADGGTPVAVHAGPNDPIQTPLTVFSGGQASPPQTLPGLDAGDLPPWPTDANASALAGPLGAPSGEANQPAKLPTLAPPQRALPPAVAGPAVLPTPAGSKATPVVETSDAGAAKPKARLQGTIKKISTRGTTP